MGKPKRFPDREASQLYLGSTASLSGEPAEPQHRVNADDLVTHGVIVGMTGSGKTGLLTVFVEEALRAGVPTLALDIKGDLPNLLLAFPDFGAEHYEAWLPEDQREATAAQRREKLALWGIDEAMLRAFVDTTAIHVITPGSQVGEPLHLLSSIERRSKLWDTDVDAAQTALSAAISLLLRMVGRDPEPAQSKEHVLLSVLAERRLRMGHDAPLGDIVRDVEEPPITEIGVQEVDAFMSPRERNELAAALNGILAAPAFASWRNGATLDVGAWMARGPDNKTPLTIVSVAHLDDQQRELVLSIILEEFAVWMRTQPGHGGLRGLLVFDEVYGFLPPHPANPATKRPIVSLMKQARAFGVGVLLATQNPMDIDYRALSNAGVWCIGRLQTDADRHRVLDALATSTGFGDLPSETQPKLPTSSKSAKLKRARPLSESAILADIVKRIPPRWFLMRNVHDAAMRLLQSRHTLSVLRGPMTKAEIQRALLRRQGC